MATPSDRKFVVFTRGQVRDIILLRFRNQLRTRINPDTGITFTADEINRITQPGSRFYIDADSIDLEAQARQARALFFSQQVRPAWSGTEMLEDYHGTLWLGANSRLPATGGSGSVNAPAQAGTVFPGSTTIGDPSAAVAVDPVTGFRYQVLTTVTTPAGGVAALSLKCIDTGTGTNPSKDTKLRWSQNKPLSAEAECTVTSDPQFSGGFNVETDSEYAARIEQNIRHRPASGNNAHFAAWAAESSVAVEQGFVYACAFHAGSVLVSITQKRNPAATTPEGPFIRVNPSEGTLLTVSGYMTPPGSSVVPENVYVVITSPNGQESDLAMRLSMGLGSASGWEDTDPWPAYSSAYPECLISAKTTQTDFEVETDQSLPGAAASLTGDDAPSLMLWNEATSRFVELDVQTVTDLGADTFRIELNADPGFTIAVGDALSPFTSQQTSIALAVEEYFDELGPGEVIDLTTDSRAARAIRFPLTSEQYQSRAGEIVISRVLDALSGVASDSSLPYISRNDPDLPSDINDGPNQVVLGRLSIFPL